MNIFSALVFAWNKMLIWRDLLGSLKHSADFVPTNNRLINAGKRKSP